MCNDEKGTQSVVGKTGQYMKLKMVRSVHEVVKYTKINIRYNILISKKL
jgi:hypothetical protein